MRKTALHEEHIALGAKMTWFATWDMPVQYTSIIDEHMAVRERAGVFDVSHMGAFIIRGENSSSLVNNLSTNDVAAAPAMKCVYTHMLNDEGKILDDTIITPLGNREYFMVPNAGTTLKMKKWISEHLHGQELCDDSLDIAKIAVQGPVAKDIVATLTSFDLQTIKWFSGAFLRLDKVPSKGLLPTTDLLSGREMLNGKGPGVLAFASRTGYTGEDGFEIFCANADAVMLWNTILQNGRPLGLKPAGLGARDTLRLEKGLLLSGTDFDGAQSTLQTGPQWAIDWRHDFIGKDAMVRQKSTGVYDRLVGMMCEGRGIPRHGYSIRSGGEKLGIVTSGTLSPVLKKGIAMGYVPLSRSEIGSGIEFESRETSVKAKIVKPPFVK